MSFQRRGGKDFGYHYITDTDRKRIDNIDSNTFMEHRKCKYKLTLSNPDIKQEICIIVYGKDLEEIKEHTQEHIKFFQSNNKKWKMSKLEDMKAREDDQVAAIY